jgi:predicted nucleotide-binding protein
MRVKREYPNVYWSAEAISKIIDEARAIVAENNPDNAFKIVFNHLVVEKDGERWTHDNLDEFLADVGASNYLWCSLSSERLSVEIESLGHRSTFAVSADSRPIIARVSNKAIELSKQCRLPDAPPSPTRSKTQPAIFIGHGNSEVWRDLKDHLGDLHKYKIVAYDTGSRSGHSIRDVLEEMLTAADFAILVMTGEDRLEGGEMVARQNVIHEIGLFQGRLGFSRAIVLKEEGTSEFSNLAGVQQIRYAKGHIRETFGDVLAVLKREFEEDGDSK